MFFKSLSCWLNCLAPVSWFQCGLLWNNIENKCMGAHNVVCLFDFVTGFRVQFQQNPPLLLGWYLILCWFFFFPMIKIETVCFGQEMGERELCTNLVISDTFRKLVLFFFFLLCFLLEIVIQRKSKFFKRKVLFKK